MPRASCSHEVLHEIQIRRVTGWRVVERRKMRDFAWTSTVEDLEDLEKNGWTVQVVRGVRRPRTVYATGGVTTGCHGLSLIARQAPPRNN